MCQSCLLITSDIIFIVIFSNSISVTSSNITKSDIHEEMKFEWSNFSKGEEIEMHSLLLMDQLSFEGIYM